MCDCNLKTRDGRYSHLTHRAKRFERILHDETTDLVHDAWEYVEKHVHRVRNNIRAFLECVLRSKFLNAIRRGKRAEPTADEVLKEHANALLNPEGREAAWPTFRNEVTTVVHAHIDRLPSGRRDHVNEWLANGGERPNHWQNRDDVAFTKAKQSLGARPELLLLWTEVRDEHLHAG